MIDKSQPLEIQARQAANIRNQLRQTARDAMANREEAIIISQKYPNKTFDELYSTYYGRGFRGDDLYSEIIKASTRSRQSVNDALGVKPPLNRR